MPSGNRRRHPRIYRPVEVQIHTGEDTPRRASTMSLSMGGLYVKTDEPMAVGSLFTVEFSLPDFEHLFKARGEVIWIKISPDVHGPPGMGVRFHGVREDEKMALVRYIAGSQKTRTGY